LWVISAGLTSSYRFLFCPFFAYLLPPLLLTPAGGVSVIFLGAVERVSLGVTTIDLLATVLLAFTAALGTCAESNVVVVGVGMSIGTVVMSATLVGVVSSADLA
jgi:hypothetical protein